jgi:hypothetical protein
MQPGDPVMNKLLFLLLFAYLIAVDLIAQDPGASYGRINADRFANKATISIVGATPSVTTGNVFVTANSSSTTITDFTGGVEEQSIEVICGETNTTIANNANIVISSGNDIMCSLNLTNRFVYDGSSGRWMHVSGPAKGKSAVGSSGTVQKTNGSNPATSSTTGSGAPVTIDKDTHFPGPNPYYDIVSYGARNISAPLVTTCSISRGSSTMTLASNSSTGILNGDSVRCDGAGPPTSLTTPASFSGTVNTSGVTVTWLSGDYFDSSFSGGTITIKDVRYVIDPIYGVSSTTLHLTTSAGTQTGVSYSYSANATPYVSAGGSTTAPFTGATTGSAFYSYKIIACDKDGGCTAATPAFGTTVGAANLGRVTATTVSMRLSNETLTITTKASHGFSPHELVCISYFSSKTPLFEGWYTVATTPDATHFTVTTSYDSRVQGTPTLDTSSATVAGFNSVHLQWPPVANAWKYYIYGRKGGAYNLIGVTTPEQNWWDDYGSPMMDSFTYPSYIPTSAPSSATNEYLLAKVTAGGGTKTLIVTPPASSTVSGATARMGSDAAIIAATTAAGTGPYYVGGVVRIPSGNFFTAGYITLPRGTHTNYRVEQIGTLNLYDTIQMPDGMSWYGVGAEATAAFGWDSLPTVGGGNGAAFPMFYLSGSNTVALKNVNFAVNAVNGGLVILGDTVTNFNADNIAMA